MSGIKTIYSFTGVSGNLIRPYLEKENGYRPIAQERFFQPYHSSFDVLNKASTVVTAPVVHSIFTGKFILKCVLHLLKCLINLILTEMDDSKYHLKKSGTHLGLSVLSFLSTITSPLTNLIDCIGSGVKTAVLYNKQQAETVEDPKLRPL